MFASHKPREYSSDKSTAIALAIKKARVEAGMTQKALADFTDIGIKIIRNLEQGHEHVNLDKLKSILDFLGLEILIVPRDKATLYRQLDKEMNKEGDTHA